MIGITKDKQDCQHYENTRIAWLLPSMARANYWHPLLSKFTKLFKQTTVYTGLWPGFTPGFEDTFTVEVVGKTKYLTINQSKTGYQSVLIQLSPAIIGYLLRSKPDIIFANGFSAWTLLAILLKFWGRWRIIIAYEGSSPGVDYRNSKTRLLFRSVMVKLADAFITNSKAGEAYLTKCLGAKASRIFTRPYEVPSTEALLKQCQDTKLANLKLRHPVFLFVGQLIPRKGLSFLLEACVILKKRGYKNYTLLVVGDGAQREELQDLSQTYDLEDCVQWLGHIDYDSLPTYFQSADVFVIPTLEDTWGMVILESMVFGKPVLCSKWAGASEMVMEGKNGYVFDPDDCKKLAELMCRFIDNPELVTSMGISSQQLIAQHTPEAAVKFFTEVISFVLAKNNPQ